jgi:AraC-like DNA-binding protein
MLSINAGGLPAVVVAEEPSKLDAPATSAQSNGHVVTSTVPARLKRTGMEMRLLIDGAGGGARTKSDHSLCRLLAQAHRYQAVMLNSRGKTLDEIAAEAGVTRSHFRRVLRVSFLAPDIVQSILRNRHPIELNAERMVRNTVLPCNFRLLGESGLHQEHHRIGLCEHILGAIVMHR